MPAQVYRQSAIDRLAAPEELDKMIKITDRKGWIALVGLTLIVIAAIVWGFLGTIPSVVRIQGVLIRQGGIQEIKASQTGQIEEISLVPGKAVTQGEIIGKLKNANGEVVDLLSSQNGRILDIAVQKNQLITAETVLVRLELETQPLQGVMFVPLAEGKKIHPGLKVHIAPSNVDSGRDGYMVGTVTTVSQFPITTEGLMATLRSRELAQTIAPGGSSLKVEVNLEASDNTFSGFKWSNGVGPNLRISSGTIFAGTLTTEERSPISLVLPIFK
jgi:HlyD family secretion protein